MDIPQNYIKPYHLWVRPVLPLVYDEALSYLETLGHVIVKLNEVIQWANDYTDTLYEYVDQKAQENLDSMLAQLNAYKAELENRLNQQDIKIESATSQINNILTTVNGIISQFQTSLDNQFSQFRLEYQTDISQFKAETTQQLADQNAQIQAKLLENTAYVNAQISLLTNLINLKSQESKDYTDQEIQKLINSLPDINTVNVIYPGNSLLVSIQEAVNLLYHDLSFFTLTAAEYDGLDLTAQQYDTFAVEGSNGLTAQQYDLYGKWYLLLSKNGGGGSGQDGKDGTTFIPSVSADGVISWTNDGGLDNPEPVNIMGPEGTSSLSPVSSPSNSPRMAWMQPNQLKGVWFNIGRIQNPSTPAQFFVLGASSSTLAPSYYRTLEIPYTGHDGYILTLSKGKAVWAANTKELPTNGSPGQVLTKTTSGVSWEDAPSGDSSIPTPTTDDTYKFLITKPAGTEMLWLDASPVTYSPEPYETGFLGIIRNPGKENVPSFFEGYLPNVDPNATGKVWTKTENGAEWQESAAQQIYSTTPQVVGKWINGKPLYQNTVEFTYTQREQPIVTLNAGESVVKYDGMIMWSQIYSATPIFYSAGNDYISSWCDRMGRIYLSSSENYFNSYLKNQKGWITYLYYN